MILERPSKGLGVEVTESKPFIEKNGGTETQGQSSGHLGENQAWNPRSLAASPGHKHLPASLVLSFLPALLYLVSAVFSQSAIASLSK